MKNIIISGLILLFIIGCDSAMTEITNFEECIAAGNPAMESYPRQCRAGDKTFTEIIDDPEEPVDGPIIGGDEDEHGCIGSAGYTWCESKQKCLRVWEEDCPDDVQEDLEKHYCTPEQKQAEACILIYQPVCGWYDPEQVICEEYPCAKTYGNSCQACAVDKVLYWTEGECPQ